MSTVPMALRLLFCATLAAAVAGCGGGGGGSDVSAPAPAPGTPAPPPPPAPPPAPAPGQPAAGAQGFWSGRVDAQTTVSAVVLAEGQAMEIFQSGAITTLVMGTVTLAEPSFTIAGRSYNLSTAVNAAYSAAGTVTPKTSLNVAAAGAVPAYTMAYNRAYEAPASLADAAGRWQASFSGGTLVLTLNVAASGVVSGSNSSGCTYSGALAPHAGGVAVFDLQLSESCPGVAAVQLSGIATLNEAKTVLAAGLVSSNLATANAFQATR